MSLLVGLAVAGGLILLVIPGLIFLIFLSVSVPVLIVENRRGPSAMSRSWNLVKGHFWHAVGVIIVAGIITGIVGGIIGSIGGRRVGRAVDLLVDRHDHHRAVHVARLRAPVPGSAFAERGADRRHAQVGAGRGRRLRIARALDGSSRQRPGPAPPAGPTGIGRRAPAASDATIAADDRRGRRELGLTLCGGVGSPRRGGAERRPGAPSQQRRSSGSVRQPDGGAVRFRAASCIPRAASAEPSVINDAISYLRRFTDRAISSDRRAHVTPRRDGRASSSISARIEASRP